MSGARTISVDLKVYAALCRLEGAAEAAIRAKDTSTFVVAREGMVAVLADLRKLRS